MTDTDEHTQWLPEGGPRRRSLGAKILVLCLGFVLAPSLIFALLAFSGARRALEDAVAVQLTQAAEEAAAAVETAFVRAAGEVGLWAQQDLMRELVIGDVDKRISRFLASIRQANEAYLDVVCAGMDGQVVAASAGHWLGRNIEPWPSFQALNQRRDVIRGPRRSEGGHEVVEIAVRIRNPDVPHEDIGVLVLLYDWERVLGLLEPVRIKLTRFGKSVAASVYGPQDDLLGQVRGDDGGIAPPPPRRGELGGEGNGIPGADVMVGQAPISVEDLSWTIAMVQPTAQALRPVADLRTRWTLVLLVVVLLSVGVAVVAARRIVRPLREVTAATRRLGSSLSAEPQLVPVRSSDEIGELAGAFNSMAQRLRAAQEELVSTAKLAFAGELAAGVAHEVRTPLAVMRSSAQMLLDSPAQQTESDAELLGTLVAEVDRIEHVVNGLVELAKPGPQRLEATRLEELLARAAAFLGRQAKGQGVTIETDFAPDARLALCDPEQVYQVVLNLVVNALQVLEGGGRIVLRTRSHGDQMTSFEVADNGPGIPERLRARIFDPFVTGRDGGTGLGLALVRRVVESHRGGIDVESCSGQGTTFRVRLPATDGKR